MKTKNISVIVPVFNTINYLKKCLDSIIGQSYSDFQIVLVDDGSTDGSGSVCDEYAKTDDRIKVIHQENAGVVKARKNGLRESDGRYIYYVDSDDWIDDRMIESLNRIVLEHKSDMVVVGNKREYESGKSIISHLPFENGLYDQAWINNVMLEKMMRTDRFYENAHRVAFWNYLIDRNLLEKNQTHIDDKIRIWDDAVVTYPCLLDAKKIYVEKDIYYHYRQRSNSLKRTKSDDEYKRFQLVYKTLVSRFVKEIKKEMLLKQAKYLLLYSILFSFPEKLEISEGVFPYCDFPKGSRVIIYGAGVFGEKVVELLRKNKYADIEAWVDKNFRMYQEKGLNVVSPEEIHRAEYDYIILGVLVAGIRENIRKSLEEEHGVPTEKIIDIDLKKIDATPLPKEFQDILKDFQNE